MNLSFFKKRRAAEQGPSAPPDRSPRWKWLTPPRPLRLAVFSLVAVAGLAAATGVTLEVTKQNIGPLPLEAAEAT